LPALHQISTARLLLRGWRDEDEPEMRAINCDPAVTRYLNRRLDAAGVDAFLGSAAAHWEQHGFGWFALESREPGLTGRVLGFAGIAYPAFLPELAHRPELGWRLARDAWGRGLATEAGTAARDDGFGRLGLAELISIIHPQNERSQRVARKLGMARQQQVLNPVIDRHVDVWRVARPT